MTVDRADELAGWYADDEPEVEITTWEPVDLGPHLRGEVPTPEPTMGIVRSDGLRLIYPGREHTVLGETESGKTWFALACVLAEIMAGNTVVYVHYEESDPASTIERLRMLGLTTEAITTGLRFVAPGRPVRAEWLQPLLDAQPSLVIHDGVNEGMALHGADIMAAEGAALFRRRVILPFIQSGAASLSCDHVPKSREGRGRDAYGSVHKGNAIDGARFLLDNIEPFGRGRRGVSSVYVTKDRPGYLRAYGRPDNTPGKTFIGVLVVDDGPQSGPDYLSFHPPRQDDNQPDRNDDPDLSSAIYSVIDAQADKSVRNYRLLMALLRQSGQSARSTAIRDAVDDLIVAGRVEEFTGKNNAKGYRISVSQRSPTETPETDGESVSECVSRAFPPIGGETTETGNTPETDAFPSTRETPGNAGKRETTERTQTAVVSGDIAVIHFHSSVFGSSMRPVRKFAVTEKRPYAQYEVGADISFIEPRKRTWMKTSLHPDDTTYVVIEAAGEIVYDSREHLPFNRDDWDSARAQFCSDQ